MQEKRGKGFFNVYITSLTSFLTDISSEMIYPLIPVFLTTVLKAPVSVLGFIEGIAESTASLMKVFSGYLSDYTGKRKPLAILGYSLSLLGKVLLYLAGSWPVVLLARFSDRFGKGVRTAPRDALISESVGAEDRGRAFGFHRAADTLGAAVGVLISYLILFKSSSNLQIKTIFLISIIPALLGVLALTFVREPGTALKRGIERPRLSSLSRPLKYFLAVAFLFSLGNSSDQFLLLKVKSLGGSVATVLLIYFAYNMAYALLSYPAGRLSDVIGRRRVLVPGYLLYAAVYFFAARATELSEMWIVFIVYGFYQALTQGVERAIIADFSPPSIRGAALGAHAMLTGIGLFPASFLAGIIWDRFGPAYVFYLGSAIALISSLLFWMLLLKYEPGRS